MVEKKVDAVVWHGGDVEWGAIGSASPGCLVDLAFLRMELAHHKDTDKPPEWKVASVEDIKDNGEGWEPRAGRKVVVNTSHAARVAVHVAEISGLMAVRILVCGVYRITPPFGRYSLASSAPDMPGLERAVIGWAEETYGDDVLRLAEGDYRSRA